MTSTPKAPHPTLDEEAVRHHLRTALDRRTPLAIWTAVADIPVLLAEVERLASLLTWARTEFANLLAAAYATLAAERDGEADPLSYLRDEVSAHAPDSLADGDR
ncbi:hypothetical protein ACNTMW_09885 [Planosporangium sp. 12N6]|uniref:hypothetical protein n=1 Tax=Planosporangium spinosum TaxID=3402278 RepID=UPI003CF5CC03